MCKDAWGVIWRCFWHDPPDGVKSNKEEHQTNHHIHTYTKCLCDWFQLSFFLNSIKAESRWHTPIYLFSVRIPQRLIQQEHSLHVNFSICNRRKIHLLIATYPRFKRMNQWRKEVYLVTCIISLGIKSMLIPTLNICCLSLKPALVIFSPQ